MNSPACKTSLSKHIAPDDDPLYGLSAEQIAQITGTHVATARRWRRGAYAVPEYIRRLLAVVAGGDEKLLREIWPSCPCGAVEQWKPIDGYPEYEISNHGRARKLAKGLWKLIATPVTPRGYCVVGLNGDTKSVHALVLTTFVGPRPEGMHACHYDGVPNNNHLTNLRWDTPSGNFEDRDRHGNTSRGSDRPTAKLSEEDIPRIMDMARAGSTRFQIADQFNVDPTTITRVLMGDSWKHVERPQ